jgi:TonB family protein
MNPKNTILAAALLVGLLPAAVFATTTEAHAKTLALVPLVHPVPARIVNPINLPPRFMGATVILSLTIDATGRPHHVTAVASDDVVVAKSVVSAVSQWKFTPGRVNGVPVSIKVTLPVEVTPT